MITITLGVRQSKWTAHGYAIEQLSDIADIIRTTCQAHPEGYKHMRKYTAGMWDGYIRLAKGSIIPTGLVWAVEEALVAHKYDVSIRCEYDHPNVYRDMLSADMFDGILLRDYQLDAVNKLLDFGRGIAKMATNSGKTEVIAAICACLTCNVLILTTKKDLLYQTSDRLMQRLGEDIGIFGDGETKFRRVSVGMVQTLSKHLPLLKSINAKCVMFDECHHVSSRTALDTMYGIDAPLRFGFSGTPIKGDLLSDLMLIGATGPILVDVSNTDLIEAGISAKPTIEMHVVYSHTTKKEFNMPWSKAYDVNIVHNGVRNNAIASIVNTSDAKSMLILVERLDHGRILQKLIPTSIFVSGTSDMADRESAVWSLRAGGGYKVIATPIFDEGVDVPSVDLLVLAGGKKAYVSILQRIGRGMRHKDGSNILRVIDFVDDTGKYALRQSCTRAEIYEEEGFEVEVIEDAPAQGSLL